jgi:hypothetical protein
VPFLEAKFVLELDQYECEKSKIFMLIVEVDVDLKEYLGKVHWNTVKLDLEMVFWKNSFSGLSFFGAFLLKCSSRSEIGIQFWIF